MLLLWKPLEDSQGGRGLEGVRGAGTPAPARLRLPGSHGMSSPTPCPWLRDRCGAGPPGAWRASQLPGVCSMLVTWTEPWRVPKGKVGGVLESRVWEKRHQGFSRVSGVPQTEAGLA